MKEALDSISKLGWAIIASVITFMVYVILERFKTRWSLFSYTKTFNSVATSINDNFYGNIKILYEETRVVKHLNFVTLNIKNESNTDFENVIVKCWVDINSQMLSFNAYHDRYGTVIDLEEKFHNNRVAKVNEINLYESQKQEGDLMPKEISNNYDFVLKNAVWNVPVWNRKDSVTFTFLIENFKGNIPLLMHPIEKKSIKQIESESLQEKKQ